MTPQTRQILIVEDDGLVQGYLSGSLQMAGHETLSAYTAKEALEAIANPENNVVMVLIDALLADMHGAELARRLLATENSDRLAICFVTGTIREAMETRAGIGALPKPVRPPVLQRTIDDLFIWLESGESSTEERSATLEELAPLFTIGSYDKNRG